MHIQINSDNIIKLGDTASAEFSETIAARLDRFSDRLTRVEVHLTDLNGRDNGTGDDKRCLIEARPASRGPVAVTSEAATLEQALASGLNKLVTALEREFGRITSRKGH
jgi:hypothetical protein